MICQIHREKSFVRYCGSFRLRPPHLLCSNLVAMAFITALPLRNIFYCSSWPSSHNRRVCATAHASATPSACFNFKAFTTLLETAQQSLVSQIEAIDQKESFCSDRWTRDDSYGHTRGTLFSLHIMLPRSPPPDAPPSQCCKMAAYLKRPALTSPPCQASYPNLVQLPCARAAV